MRYGIGALSRDTGCNIETIRYYERIGLLPEPPRSAGGHRTYAAEHTRTLDFILRARTMGFSLAEIRRLLSLSEAEAPCDDVQAMALTHISAIRNRIAELEQLAATLQNATNRCAGNSAPHCPVIDTLFDDAKSA